ncbi:BURP domain-containing protein 3-like isoform X2 [Magnolia sinica]|uniref:BURP domain-containing protein 3-like isoform X2 n=1 Tax=Magnolia sinica TaxID=86752 RepID=UPI00265B5939|nr:BURP domain-containing protein 3-like isoform X2 [Magnolia sinica]
MDRCLSFFSFELTAAAVGSHATSPSEAYWQKVLPNTPMPSAVRDFFNLDLMDEKTGTTIDVGKVKHKGGVNENTGHKGKPVVIHAINPKYRFAAPTDAADQLRDQKVAVFFLKKDLHTGARMNLIFPKAITGSTLLRGSLSGPPLDGKKLPEIINKFSIEPKSPEAKAIKKTLQACTEPAIKGEDRYCTTSIESMIDFTVSNIGTDVQVLATTVGKDTSNQMYTIAPGVQKMRSPKSVACHPQIYVYPVYYCHETHATSAYVVPLVGTDGSKVKAVAMCHEDTSSWNPKHISFQLLKVKPGSVPICHFLSQDNIVWVQK